MCHCFSENGKYEFAFLLLCSPTVGRGEGGVHVQTYESCVLIALEHVKEVELSCSESRQDGKRGNSDH